jgi:hypothetical protein
MPIPPAPTIPKTADDRVVCSKLNKAVFINAGMAAGRTAQKMAPMAVKASLAPGSAILGEIIDVLSKRFYKDLEIYFSQ